MVGCGGALAPFFNASRRSVAPHPREREREERQRGAQCAGDLDVPRWLLKSASFVRRGAARKRRGAQGRRTGAARAERAAARAPRPPAVPARAVVRQGLMPARGFSATPQQTGSADARARERERERRAAQCGETQQLRHPPTRPQLRTPHGLCVLGACPALPLPFRLHPHTAPQRREATQASRRSALNPPTRPVDRAARSKSPREGGKRGGAPTPAGLPTDTHVQVAGPYTHA